MIDPFHPEHFNATTSDLEEFLLFCVVVAGKTATIQTKLLDKFLKSNAEYGDTPFEIVRGLHKKGVLDEAIRGAHLGQYRRLNKTFFELAFGNLDLRNCTVADLESIHGIGPKTARFFIMYTKRETVIAVIDTHILKFLKDKGHIVPKATPSAGKLYSQLEALFISYALAENKSPQVLDLEVWTRYTKTSPLTI
jgi:thermostable 8-oxoguanine DNA glycosylase